MTRCTFPEGFCWNDWNIDNILKRNIIWGINGPLTVEFVKVYSKMKRLFFHWHRGWGVPPRHIIIPLGLTDQPKGPPKARKLQVGFFLWVPNISHRISLLQVVYIYIYIMCIYIYIFICGCHTHIYLYALYASHLHIYIYT